MIKRLMIEKMFNLIIILFLVFVISFSVYSYMTFRVETNSLKESFDVVKDALANAGIYDSLTGKANKIFFVTLLQIIAFLASSLSLLFILCYVFRLYTLEKKSSHIDLLTGVYNRRAMMVALKHELERAKEFKHPLSIAVVDVDYFKQYNDLYGPLRGNSALHRIAKILAKNVRGVDIVGRIGGEEFMIVFPETDAEGARNACEKIRKQVEKTWFAGEKKLPSKKFTISIGISSYYIGTHGIKTGKNYLIETAYKKLYAAKHLGRNTVVV